MQKDLVIPVLLSVFISCYSASDKKPGRSYKSVNIPFYFGQNDYLYQNNGPTIVQIKNEADSIVFEHKGKWNFWGSSTREGLLKQTGKYFVTVIFHVDSLHKSEIKEEFNVNGNEMIDMTVSLSQWNQIIVNKYFGNELKIAFKRIWDPQKQFFGRPDTTLLPEYDITNTSDSILYGIYHRFSLSESTSWVQLHYIGFLSYQKFHDGEWIYFANCNAPRIQMDLKPGETGNTLKDMKNDCGFSNFKKGERYRIRYEYGINNTIVRENTTKDSIPYYYVEPHIYTIHDEFSFN